jgi:chaperonin GroES
VTVRPPSRDGTTRFNDFQITSGPVGSGLALERDKERNPMAKIRPLEDRVVIQQIEAEEKTAGGIVLPDTAKEKPQRGRVLAVGPGKLLDSGERAAIGVVEGDEVLFGKYSGTEIKVDGEEIKILRESDILAKIVK